MKPAKILSSQTKPTHSYEHAGPVTPLDRIVENQGPYIMLWAGVNPSVETYLTKRDISHVREGRKVVYKLRGEIVRMLAIRNNAPKWIEAKPSETKLTYKEKEA
jgi:hypothetical protein